MGELLRRLMGRGSRVRQARLERFGAIVQLEWPRALAFVDRAYARDVLRMDTDPELWNDPAGDGAIGATTLTAPLEAHLQLTNRCDAGCKTCYTGASPSGTVHEWGLAQWMTAIDALADAGVFHVALGGGESAVLPWLGDVARHARAHGLIPNLTTSGLSGLDAILAIHELFGQINVSLDGLGATYARVRGFDGFAQADAAIRALRANKRDVGINVVVTRENFSELDALFAYARRRRLSEVELLRLKPAGRGAHVYANLRCTDDQHRQFLPTILAAARRHRVRVKVDCSYTPMLAHHRPDPALLAQLAVYGCTGGDFLIAAKPGGQLAACSFAAPPRVSTGHRPRVDGLAGYWRKRDAFGAFRRWQAAPQPCRSCPYHALCRGGCRVVASHICGDEARPDPECPRVIDFCAAAGPARARRRLPVL